MHAKTLIFSTALVALAGTGCAGATAGSGVGDRYLEQPPWYAGSDPAPAAEVRHLGVGYQRGASQPAIFDPAEAGAVGALIADMNRYLDSLRPGARLEAELPGTPPDVRFGCEEDASGDCAEAGDQAGAVGDPVMRLAVGRPSGEWTQALGAALEADSALALVITLEIGQYYPRQTNLAGAKAVDLGTSHVVRLPWLTSLETPVSVVQLTGALVGADGRAVRIGAEGLMARRTGLIASGFGLQALIRDEDVEALRSSRREDLPGSPLTWQVALRNLLAGLAVR